MNFVKLAMAATGVDMGSLYRSASVAMTGYCKWITSQALEGDAREVLSRAKQHALSWFNAVDPEYLALPAAVVAADARIGPMLDTLADLARQLHDGAPAQPIGEGIVRCADDLRASVQQLSDRAHRLAGALDTSMELLRTDAADFLGRAREEDHRCREMSRRLAALQGEAHAREAERCPDHHRIRLLRMEIDPIQRGLVDLARSQELMLQGESRAQDALASTTYLARFWHGAAEGADGSLLMLAQVRREPGRVRDVDVAQAHARWTQLVRDFDRLARGAG